MRSSSTRVRSIAARVRAGHDVVVLDLSPSGALIAGARPLPPGARIDVQLSVAASRFVITAQVVRCSVAAIDAEQGITYQAGLSFERRFEWACEEETLTVSHMPEAFGPELVSSVEHIPSIGSRPRRVAPEYSK
jgi:hypothetical protein